MTTFHPHPLDCACHACQSLTIDPPPFTRDAWSNDPDRVTRYPERYENGRIE